MTTVCLYCSLAILNIGVLGTNVATTSWLHWSPVSWYTSCFIMTLKHSRSPKYFDYKLGSSILNETDGHHYLGVYITNNLTWNKNIQITSKANQTLGFVTRNLYSCSQHTKEAAYRTLVRQLVEYSSAVWDPYTKDLINQLEKVQKRAARFVCGDFTPGSEGCVSNMIKSLDWDSLANRRKIHRLTVFQQACHLLHLHLHVVT